jgi:hypothetical protein
MNAAEGISTRASWCPAVLIACAAAIALTGCGGATRSVASYCSYFYGEGSQLRNRWIKAANADAQNPFAELSNVFADLPEAANFLNQLSERAPEEIAPDVKTLAEALKHVSADAGSAVSDPLGALASGLVDGLETRGAEQRVNEYTLRNCGKPPGTTG